MSNRLQVLVSKDLEERIAKAAQRLGLSKGAWVRRVLEEALSRGTGKEWRGSDPLSRLEALDAPTADITEMISEIESGRR